MWRRPQRRSLAAIGQRLGFGFNEAAGKKCGPWVTA